MYINTYTQSIYIDIVHLKFAFILVFIMSVRCML